MKFKQDIIAYYLRLLLDRVKQLKNAQKNAAKKRDNVEELPLPFFGPRNALSGQAYEIVEVVSINLLSRTFTGKRLQASQEFLEEMDQNLDPIEVNCAPDTSVPDVEDVCIVFFAGTFGDDDSENAEVPVTGRYIYSAKSSQGIVGKTVSRNFPYPEMTPIPNTYEIDLYQSVFPEIPGRQTSTDTRLMTVIGFNWCNSPTYCPEGTRIIPTKSNDRYFFQYTQCCSTN